MTVEWKDVCPRCEAVHGMPDDGQTVEHVCDDRMRLLATLEARQIQQEHRIDPQSFWGINREADPLRLSGYRVTPITADELRDAISTVLRRIG